MPTDVYPKAAKLKDGTDIVIRPLARDDFDRLHLFFRSLPEGDRIFLRHDVSDPEMIRKWTEELDFSRVLPLIALEKGEIVGNGSLHMMNHGWMRHVGHVRLVTANTHRHKGLGGLLSRELVALAEAQNLEKLQAHVIEDNRGAVRMFEAVGFKTAAVLEGMVKDQTGRERNLAIMLNTVANLSRVMENWIQEMMLPSHRVPGDGA